MSSRRYARCNRCDGEVEAKSAHGTTSLSNHLAKCRPERKNAYIRQALLGVARKNNEGK